MQIAKSRRFLGLLLLLVAGSAQSQTTFVYTGSNQTYTIPTRASGIRIDSLGASGGGGGADAPGNGGSGAAGTRAVGIYAAVAGTSVDITVGGGGSRGTASDNGVCTPGSAGQGGLAGGTGGVTGGPGGSAGCGGFSGGGGGGGAASIVRQAGSVLLAAGGGSGGQGGALNVVGGNGQNQLTSTTTATTVNSPAAPGSTPPDGGGGGGGGSGCPSGSGGAANPDNAPSNNTVQATSGGSCSNASLISAFAVSGTGGTGGAGGVGNRAAGADGTNGSVLITPLPSVVPSFAPSTILSGGTSVLTLTLANANDTAVTLSAAFVNALPSGMTLANATFGGTCTGAKSGTAGGGTITYASGASIPTNGSCTITANVTSITLGTASNTIAVGALQTNFGYNAVATAADLTVNTLPTVTLKKNLVDTLAGVFNLSVTGGSASGGTNPANNVGDGGTTGAVTVSQGATITLTETAGTNTSLANYTSSLSCVDGNGANVDTAGASTTIRTITAPGAGATGGARNVTCTYTNTETNLPASRPVLGCASDGRIFNTAYGGSPTGSAKASGLDDVWQRGTTFGVTQPQGWTLATIVTSNPGWTAFSAFPGSGWIAHQANGAHGLVVDLWYRYVFTMQANVIPSTFRLAMDFYADNSVSEILVNGVPQGPPSVTGVPDADPYFSQHYRSTPGAQISANLNKDWKAGINTLMVRVSSGAPYLGFMSRNTISALCQTTLTLSKVTQGGAGGLFTITGLAPNANGVVSQSITTAVAGIAVGAPTQTVTTSGAVTDLQESAMTGGYTLSDISCSGLGVGGVATKNYTNAVVDGIPARSVRLDAAATAAGSNIACTFTNWTPTIQFTKALAGSRVAAGDQFAVAIRTGGVSGTVVSSTTNSTTAGSGAAVTTGTGTTGSYFATAATAYTLTEAAAGGASLANYSSTLTCVDTAGVQTGLPAAVPFIPASGHTITPLAGAALVCTLTNTPIAKITLQKALGGLGRLAAADQFTVDIRTGGVSGTVVNSTTNATTLGSGATVTAGSGSTGVYASASGSAYTLNESMAAGSGSTLDNYIRTLGCTNVGGTTNVSGFSSLPLTFSPLAGDNVVCTVTNTPAVAVVSGRVFLDNGVGSGTANDGLINGGEAGLSGITVRLTNCSATVYASSVTDGTGAYNLNVPTGTATGAALCVEQTNSGTRISTGASVGGTALPSGTATSVASIPYTYSQTATPGRIAFTWNGTGHGDLNFGDVGASTFAAGGAKTAQPSTTVSYPHIFTAGTGGSVSFSVSAAAAAPALSGWSEKIFADPGCTGTLQAGMVLLYPPTAAPTSVVFGQQVCVLMQQFIPATAQIGYSNDATVQANFSYGVANPALPAASYILHDLTTVDNSALELRKEVRNVTQGVLTFGINNQAKSGETLEYRILYTNNSSTAISNLVVGDTTPPYTSFVSSNTGTTTPATLTACTKNTPANPAPAPAVSCATTQPQGSTGAVSWRFTGSLSPGKSGDVLFQVKVD